MFKKLIKFFLVGYAILFIIYGLPFYFLPKYLGDNYLKGISIPQIFTAIEYLEIFSKILKLLRFVFRISTYVFLLILALSPFIFFNRRSPNTVKTSEFYGDQNESKIKTKNLVEEIYLDKVYKGIKDLRQENDDEIDGWILKKTGLGRFAVKFYLLLIGIIIGCIAGFINAWFF